MRVLTTRGSFSAMRTAEMSKSDERLLSICFALCRSSYSLWELFLWNADVTNVETVQNGTIQGRFPRVNVTCLSGKLI